MTNSGRLAQHLDSCLYPRLTAALEAGSHHRVSADQFLFRQGDTVQSLSLVLSGMLEISYIDPEGNYVIIERCGPGFWYGDAAFVDQGRLPYSALVLEPVQILSVPHLSIQAEPELMAETYRLVATNVVARLRIMYGKFDSLATRPLEERLLERLTQLRGQASWIQVSHDELASYLGVSRHKVSRAMKRLDQTGRLEQGYRKVKIRG